MPGQASQPQGILARPPGELSLGGVLDLGLKCAHSCAFCYYSYMDKSSEQFQGLRRAKFLSREHCQEVLRLFSLHGLLNYDVTGGEPTLHPDLAQIIRYGSQLGLAGRVITLGQYLMRPTQDGPKLVDALLKAGLASFLFSIHAVNEADFKRFTGGSFKHLRAALDHLDNLGFEYSSNSVVFEGNYRDLPQIAKTILSHGIYAHNFIVFNAYYEWDKANVVGVQPRFSQVRPYLSEAVSLLEAGGVCVNLRYAPVCAFPDLSKNLVGALGLQYDPHEWRNRAANHAMPPEYRAELLPIEKGGIRPIYVLRSIDRTLDNGLHLAAARGENFKVFLDSCLSCPALNACDGLDPKYLELYGASEIVPLAQATLHGPILAERLAYAPAFRVKTAPFAKLKGI